MIWFRRLCTLDYMISDFSCLHKCISIIDQITVILSLGNYVIILPNKTEVFHIYIYKYMHKLRAVRNLKVWKERYLVKVGIVLLGRVGGSGATRWENRGPKLFAPPFKTG